MFAATTLREWSVPVTIKVGLVIELLDYCLN